MDVDVDVDADVQLAVCMHHTMLNAGLKLTMHMASVLESCLNCPMIFDRGVFVYNIVIPLTICGLPGYSNVCTNRF